MPVKNAYDEIIAVAQVINKNPDKDDGHFTNKDEKVSALFWGPTSIVFIVVWFFSVQVQVCFFLIIINI